MLNLRKAHIGDCKVIYELRNDPQVRENSFSKEAITYESHTKWFEKSLMSNNRKIFIVEDNQEIAGVVRFDLNSEFMEALVSINVKAAYWGKGVGSFALAEGEKSLITEFPELKGIVAKVLPENEGSKKLFSKCNYIPRVIEFYKEVE
jgi:RimJ/RimL family protein N-acetyltransferase